MKITLSQTLKDKGWDGYSKQVADTVKEAFDKPKQYDDFLAFMKSRSYINQHIISPTVWLRCWVIYNETKSGKQDHLVLVTGEEGAGKSRLAKIISIIIDPNYTFENLMLNKISFYDGLENPNLKVLHMDEGMNFSSTRRRMSLSEYHFNTVLSKCRKYSKVIVLCVPKFEELGTYVRKWRVRTLFHIPLKYAGIQAWTPLRYFNKNGVKDLIQWCDDYKKVQLESYKIRYYPKRWVVKRAVGQYLGDFNPAVWLNCLPFTYEEYESFKERDNAQSIKDAKKYEMEGGDTQYMDLQEVEKLTGLSRSTLHRYCNEGRLEGINLGQKWLVKRECLEKKSLKQVKDVDIIER